MNDDLQSMIQEDLLPMLETRLYANDSPIGRVYWLTLLQDSLQEALRLTEVELERLRQSEAYNLTTGHDRR